MNWSMRTIWTVTVIDADSRRMTVRWVLFPFPKGGLVLRALGCMGLLLMPRSLGCCGESGSLSQCIRYDADVLRGVHDWSSRPAARRSCVCACAAACLRRGKSVRMACVLWTRNHKKDLRAPRWCQIPWASGHMANTQPTCGVCVCVCLWTNRMTVTVRLGCNMLNVTALCVHIDCQRNQVPSALCGSVMQR